MNSRQKEILQSQLDSEEVVFKKLQGIYKKALDDIDGNIAALIGRTDTENLQSIVYQLNYQNAIKSQINGILDNLKSEQYATVSDYLAECYESGFLGTMYDLHGQGIPLVFPINQDLIVRAVKNEAPLVEAFYDYLGEDVDLLKKRVTNNISRGMAQGSSYAEIAKNIERGMVGDYSKVRGGAMYDAYRIARTEGHRITNAATFDAQKKAKDKGADIVKQWDAAMDKRTRESHARVDGEIRELDERFSNGLLYPGDSAGGAAEVINCRCALLQRARWALDETELQTLKDRAEYFGLDKTDSFEEFKKKYLDSSENVIYNGAGSVFDKFDRKASIITPEEDLAKVNLNFSTREYQWTNNCQRCVPTYEMRRRGFNVVARPITTSISNDALANNYAVAWTNQDRVWCMKGSGLQQIKDQMSAWGDGARAEVFVSWSGDLGGSIGHVFVAEQMNGNTVFFDPQSGDSNCVRYFKIAAKGKTNILRIDNNTPSDYILDCCKNVGE